MDHRGDGWFLGSLEVFKGAAGFVYFTFHFQIEKQTPTLDNNTSSGDGWFLGSSEAFKDAADFLIILLSILCFVFRAVPLLTLRVSPPTRKRTGRQRF